jgi:CubicO group peptidase (beta-lactamase class C family)
MKVRKVAAVVSVLVAMLVPRSRGQESFDSLVRGQMEKQQIPGIAIVVVRSGRVVKEGAYGQADVELDVPLKESTVFQIASTTKIFTGVALGKLEQEKMLSLDDAVGLYLPDLPAGWKGITLKQMAAHVSGLPDIIESPNAPLSAAFLRRSEHESIVYAESQPLQGKPGEKFNYDQTNFVLLRAVIEKVSRMPFEEFVDKSVFEPLDMKSTTWGDARAIVHGRANLYSTVGAYTYLPEGTLSNSNNPYVYPAYMSSAAGLNTSVEDLGKFAVALAEGKLLAAPELERIWAPARHPDGTIVDIAKEFEIEGTLSPAIGWFRLERPGGGHASVFMEGGSSTAFMYFPDDKLAVAVLTNLQGADPVTIAEGIAALYIPDLKKVF